MENDFGLNNIIAPILLQEVEVRDDISDEAVAEIVQACLEQGGLGLYETLKKNRKPMLRENAQVRRQFQSRLQRTWRKPLRIYETCVVIAQEMGDEFNHRHRPQAAADQNFEFEALTRLHGRVCHLAEEILALLRSGFASGAMARWRAMHEVVVVMAFIAKHGKNIAERYLLHEHIEGFKAAKEYTNHFGFDGEISEEVLNENTEKKDELVSRFGASYNMDYGWAAPFIPDKERPSIPAMEKDVQLEKVRPRYRLASHPTHANPKSILYSLELGQRPKIILVGASDTGLADPGANALQQIALATSILLNTNIDETGAMSSMALLKMTEEGAEAFAKVHNEIELRMKRGRK